VITTLRTIYRSLILSILVAFSILLPTALGQISLEPSGEYLEALAIVTRVIDGDTFDAKVIAIYKDRYSNMNGSIIRVRLADINAPELGTPEGDSSRSALKNLLEGREVYLDIDDLYVYDRYGRVVAITYLQINSTHLLNINLWLVTNGYASIIDYPNEFKPHLWSLYIAYITQSKESAVISDTRPRSLGGEIYLVMLIAILGILVAILLYIRLRGR
jgi:endonuclease YncB( thermonuclease family)